MAEYSKKTVAELQEILKSRSLPSSGKKADLIARLTEADKAAEIATETAEPTPPAVAPTQPEATDAPEAQPDAEDATAPQAAGETTEPVAEERASPATETKIYALNLAASDVDKEMQKRKARAERFKTGGQAKADAEVTETASADADALKNLERARRFGTGQTAIGKLDEALPSERERGPRGQKRGGVPEASALDDPGLKKNFDRHGRFAKRRRGGPDKPTGVAKPATTAFTSDRDREAAEARKKRFAQS